MIVVVAAPGHDEYGGVGSMFWAEALNLNSRYHACLLWTITCVYGYTSCVDGERVGRALLLHLDRCLNSFCLQGRQQREQYYY